MNFFIKDHHFTRKIESISGTRDGMILIVLKSTVNYSCEHLLFLKDEIDCSTKETLLIGSLYVVAEPSQDLPGDSPGSKTNIHIKKV